MKKYYFIYLFLISVQAFCQQTIISSFTSDKTDILIETHGIDAIVLEESSDNMIRVYLDDENTFKHTVKHEEENNQLVISFDADSVSEELIFRKFITERLNRARVKIKIPEGKNISFTGEEIDITSKDYSGNISIYIQKGELDLGELYGNTTIYLYSGNVKAQLIDASINIANRVGSIIINNKNYQKSYTLKRYDSNKTFFLETIKANVVLTTIKPQ